MELWELHSGAWYTHPNWDGQVLQAYQEPTDLVWFGFMHDLDGESLHWKANGAQVVINDEVAADLEWAWGGPNRTVTLVLEVPVADPHRGASIIDPISNLLLGAVEQGLLGEDDWYWEGDL